jgi:hypothetical protein
MSTTSTAATLLLKPTTKKNGGAKLLGCNTRKRISFGHVEYISVEEGDDENESVSTVRKFQLFNMSLNLT